MIREWVSLIKFSHTVFALPFALAMVVLAHRYAPLTLSQLFYILVAMVAARSAAMAWNRYLDRDIDALNPRTALREIPRGAITPHAVLVGTVLASAIFFFASFKLGMHCLVVSPFVLGVLLSYSWMKRWSSAAHLVLGLCLALAPGGVWYALTERFSWFPIPLMVGVLFWVAGFDILYSCQDATFDSKHGLHSIPARFGIARAFWIARASHVVSLAFFTWFGILAALSPLFWVFYALFSFAMIRQHFIATPTHLEKIDAAFFTQNGAASIVFLAGVLCGG